MIRTSPSALLPLFLALLCGVLPPPVSGQDSEEVTDELLQTIFPDASRFGEKEGEPPVYRAYGTDADTGAETLLGFVFLTADVPPETEGYNAPIRTIVGMDVQGTLTGARVLSYRESLRSNRGDFLGRPGVQGQFAGKTLTDGFRPRQDVRNVTGATISVRAMAVGIRNAARRVAVAYLMEPARAETGPAPRIGTISLDELERLTWPEMVQLGLVLEITEDVGEDELLRVSTAYLRDREMMEAVLGSARIDNVMQQARERSADGHLIFVGLNGPNIIGFGPERISLVQGSDTLRFVREDFVITGRRSTGKAGGEFQRTGILVVDPALDVRRPWTVAVDLRGDRGTASARYQAFPDPPTVASGGGAEDGSGDRSGSGGGAGGEAEDVPAVGPTDGAEVSDDEAEAEVADAEAAPGDPAGSGATGRTADPSVIPPPDPEPSPAPGLGADFTDEELAAFLFPDEEEEETALSRTLAQISWPRVISLLALLGLVTWAFALKKPAPRWIALAGTLGFLGFVDRGFLSVSHILAAISVGPDVFLGDASLLILVSFTVVTTLLWGRVFCGFLCPFGVLQDLLERVVPRRFRRELPRGVHEKALWAKYGILILVLAPAVLGLSFTLYHWFEPFGTVFFWSPSILLWAIALGILAASAVVPRFYCRYACPLGAALAVGSLLSPFRIRRVEQCTICTVCERTCPTGAIHREKIDFKECVRCNECETRLIDRAGVCKHDMETIRPRLVQMTVPVPGAPGRAS